MEITKNGDDTIADGTHAGPPFSDTPEVLYMAPLVLCFGRVGV